MSLINSIGIYKIIIYLLILNLIPESTLMALVLIGGGIGGIAGMYKFHHKTKKPKFYLGFPAMLILEIAVFIYVLIKY